MSLTVTLREELAHVHGRPEDWLLGEAMALADCAGTLRVRGGGQPGTSIDMVVRCSPGAVARRLRQTLVDLFDTRPGISRRQGANLKGGDAYLVELDEMVLKALGILGEEHRPRHREPNGVPDAHGYVAGALMAGGTLSGSGQPTHLEIRTPRAEHARWLASWIPGSRAVGDRAVCKSGDAVSRLLGDLGARQTREVFLEGRRRRALRGQLTREVNAERANLRRATAAAGGQIRAIEALVAELGWDGIPDDLVGVALARVANPAATLAELGELLDPPVGKATVHRRLRRINELAASEDM